MFALVQKEGQRPIHVWSKRIDSETLRLLDQIASHPAVEGHVASMSDAHVAHTVAVGTVFATRDTVLPQAIGGDIGCGMAALPFSGEMRRLDRRRLEALLEDLGKEVPVGDAKQRMPHRGCAFQSAALSTSALRHRGEYVAPLHFGTLGGGNHFLEIDREVGTGRLWCLLHTGSRGVGGAIAEHHQRVALSLSPGARLAGLKVDTDEGRAYLADLDLAVAFARENRDAILSRAADIMAEHTHLEPAWAERVDVFHNFIRREEHGAGALFVHRKGATSAQSGELGIIPGSMGTASYIVRGRGSAASFASCSHGAGRVLSRSEARKRFKRKDLAAMMKDVVFDESRARNLVEEAPKAYRNIAQVIEEQSDLIEPVARLEPLAVLKG